jgi:hypothetical protein
MQPNLTPTKRCIAVCSRGPQYDQIKAAATHNVQSPINTTAILLGFYLHRVMK